MYRIMLVDDKENILKALRRALSGLRIETGDGKEKGLHVETFSSPKAALERASYSSFDLVISDYRMPEINGVDFLKALRVLQPNIARLILSGYADLDSLIRAINDAGIARFIAKPWHDYELAEAVSQVLAYRALLLENERLADLVRVQAGQLSQQELALKQLEQEHPGLTKVTWGPDGSVLLTDNE